MPDVASEEFFQAIHETVGGFPQGVHTLTMATPKRFGEKYVFSVKRLRVTVWSIEVPNDLKFDKRSRDYVVFLDHTESSPHR